MLEVLKRRLAETLHRKAVSLALIYDREGVVLWHSGRSIRGATVFEGEGFSRTAILNTLKDGKALAEDDVVVSTAADDLPQSARTLFIRSLLVRPLASDLFLYVDSGTKDAFDEADRQVLDTIGSLLAETLVDARERAGRSGGLIGTSAAMTAVRDLTVKYAIEDEPVLLVGETGVGKGRVAELLHDVSGRRGPLVVVDSPSIPEGLFENELFGHRRGAFTGATEDRKGLVDEAENGTLFLDEIGDVPATFQAKLLRFVETRRYRLVGDSKERVAAVRLVAATSRDLAAEVRARRFREDLYYRLSVLRIVIPPLRERKEDLRTLVREHARRLRGKLPAPGFWDVLLAHNWPGNVRELLHVLTRAGVELNGPEIGKDVAAIIDSACNAAPPSSGGENLRGIGEELSQGRSFWDTAWKRFLSRDLNRREMRQFLEGRFESGGRSIKRLAADLNVTEKEYARFVSTLHRYDIHPGR